MLAEPPAGSDLEPVMGDSGLPVIGHLIEVFAAARTSSWTSTASTAPSTTRTMSRSQVMALGPDATQAVFSNRNKEFSQRASGIP